MEPWVYSQSVRSTGDNLDFQMVPEAGVREAVSLTCGI